MNFISSFIFVTVCFVLTASRKHHLVLENDFRKYFSITTFGFLKGGELEVNVYNITFLSKYDGVFGLTLTRTVHDSLEPYIESNQKCLLLDNDQREDSSIEFVSFILDPHTNEVFVNCSKLSTTLEIQPVYEANATSSTLRKSQVSRVKSKHLVKRQVLDDIPKPAAQPGEPTEKISDSKQPDEPEGGLGNPNKQENAKVKSSETLPNPDLKDTAKSLKADVPINPTVEVLHEVAKDDDTNEVQVQPAVIKTAGNSGICSSHPKLFYNIETVGNKKRISNLKFLVTIKNENAEGLYSLFFHNCAGSRQFAVPVNLSIAIIERNGESYLSAGEIPLPQLYFFMSCVFCIIGGIWMYVVRKKKSTAFKLHYLMGLLVFLKSLSLLFHGINFHNIAKDGFPMQAWAVLYYVTHLLKGALLFITIVLIGTGWAFIKHVLNDRDKKIFVVFIPLQVLANVAKIIMEESEEGNARYYYWKEVFILVDLMCCGAILVPVVWSIKHLQEASETDGKAAINLKKLKLFRQFYIMIVCYIYFTRIIVYLLKITVPFQYEWMDEMFREVATLVFFILTGYNFRPTSSNPYFRVPQEDDLEMDEVIVGTKISDTVTRTMRSRDFAASSQEKVPLKRESSHEYD